MSMALVARVASAEEAPVGAPADKPTGAFPKMPRQSPTSEPGSQPPSAVPSQPTVSRQDAYSASQREPAYSGPPAYGQWAPGPYYPPPWTAPTRDAADDSDEHENWYGWQTLAVDGTSLAVAIGGAASNVGALGGFGLVGYVAGAPIVHFAHGHVGTGFASAGLRVGLPIVGALIGFAAEDCHGGGEFCGLGGAAVGLLVGGAAAITLDAAVLAREEVKPEPGPIQRLGISPVLDPQKRLAAVKVSGAF
jgi:hypothetical protein